MKQKFFIALALAAILVCAVKAQDYDDDEGGSSRGGDGYGGFSGGDDDYAAPRDRGLVGAEGSDINPGYHQGDEGAGNENYEGDDSAAAASQAHPSIARPNLIQLIKTHRSS